MDLMISTDPKLAHQPSTALYPDIIWLRKSSQIPSTAFGRKAAVLSLPRSMRRLVPPGFAISKSLVGRIATGSVSSDDRVLLGRCWETIQRKVGNSSIIVRSSSSLEDSENISFSGLFRSIGGIQSYEDFLVAVRDCHESGHSLPVQRYAALRDAYLPREHMGVIVQTEITARYSALIHVSSQMAVLIEAYTGSLNCRIQGVGMPEYVSTSVNGRHEVVRASNQIPVEFIEQINALARDVHLLLRESRWDDAVFELASDGTGLSILQADKNVKLQRVSHDQSSDFDMRSTPLEALKISLGIKGAAMRYFSETGLFPLPLCAFPPECEVATMETTAQATLPKERGFTARFAMSSRLALPRQFSPELPSLLRWVESTRESGWATIIHPHIQVQRSFELLLTHSEALLEHIPGMWESDNVLDPDVLMFKNLDVLAWQFKKPRLAHLASTYRWELQTAPSVAISEMKQWTTRLTGIVDTLKRDFASSLPLNFHFVEDDEGRWHFLNIRRGFHLERPEVSETSPHIVTSAQDLADWNGRAPILIRFTAARGDESRILDIVEKLPSIPRFPLLVDFGLLSHPAMILRELGYMVVPTYLHGGLSDVQEKYLQHHWSVDQGMDPVHRIRNEPPIFKNRGVHIVADCDPIVPGHLLMLAETRVPSFSDAAVRESITDLLTSNALPHTPYLFVERGRARFCTSGFTDCHAHGHLFPLAEIDFSAVSNFTTMLDARCYDSLATALQHAKESDGEYILVAEPKGKAFLRVLPPGRSFEKRLIRRFFSRGIQ